MLITGSLHEDGAGRHRRRASAAGNTRERKLEIMRDSRIGTYGALALILSVLMRACCWRRLAVPALACSLALVASHAASRALLPAFMQLVPPARPDGLSAGAGRAAGNIALDRPGSRRGGAAAARPAAAVAAAELRWH